MGMIPKKISQLPAGTPPYAGDVLLEISVVDASAPSGYVTRKALLSDIVAALLTGLTPDGLLYTTEAHTIADTLGTPPNDVAFGATATAGALGTPGYQFSGTFDGGFFAVALTPGSGSSSSGLLEVDAFTNFLPDVPPTIAMVGSEGTPEAPVAVKSGDWLGNINAAGYNGTPGGFNFCWFNYIVAEEDFDATHGAASYHLQTTNLAETTEDRIVIDNNGNTQIVNGKLIAGGGGFEVDTAGHLSAANLYTADAAALVGSNTSLNNGAGASLGTLTDAPSAGNPTKWIPIDDNGTTRYIPAW